MTRTNRGGLLVPILAPPFGALAGRWLLSFPHPLLELAGNALLALWLNLIALAIGKLASRDTLRDHPRPIRAAACGALGWFLLSLLAFLLGVSGLLIPELAWGLLLVGGTLALVREWEWLGSLWRAWRDEFAPRPLPERLVRAGVLVVLGVAFLCLVTPPVFYDAMTYHLAVPQAYLNAGRIVDLPYNFYSSFPQGIDMLFLLGLLLADATLAHFISFSFGILAGAALFGLARHRFGFSATASWLTVLLAVATPVLWDYLSQAAADIPPVLYLVLAVWFLTVSRGERFHPGWLGVVTGLAMTVKYTLWFALPLHLLLALVAVRPLRMACRGVAVAALVALAVAAPWPVKNLWLTGNPVYPFGDRWFPVVNMDPALRAGYQHQGFDLFGTPKTVAGYFLRPWEMTMSDEQFGKDTIATIGPLFLLFVPFAFLRRFPGLGRVVVYLLVWYTWWSVTSQQTRHILFLLALAAPLAAHGARQLWRPGWKPLVAAVLVVALAHNLGWALMKKESFYDSFDYLAGRYDRAGYLTRHYLGYPAVERVNRLPADAKVLFIGHEFGAYVERDSVVAPSYNRDPVERLLLDGETAAGIAAKLKAAGFTHLLWSEPGLAFKRGFGHYQLSPAAAAALAEFRSRSLLSLSPPDDVTLYLLR